MKYKVFKIFLTILFLVNITLSFKNDLGTKRLGEYNQGTDIEEIEGVMSLKDIDPIELINRLRITEDRASNFLARGDESYSVTVYEAPSNWITDKHLKELINLVDSDEPARPVCSVYSSYIPIGKLSTVGNEAMFLLEGFRKGYYPSEICSIDYFEGRRYEYIH